MTVTAALVSCVMAGTLPLALHTSKQYWGYWFERPDVLPQVTKLVTVEQIYSVETQADGGKFVANEQEFEPLDPDHYSFLDERHWHTLVEAGLIPSDFTFESELGPIADLYQQLPETGLLAERELGYDEGPRDIQGVITVGSTATGERRLLASLTGHQVSNDHYPYYEMVFAVDPGTGVLTYLDGQRFFYDLAGFEGFEWYVIWWAYSFLGFVITVPPLVLWILWGMAAQARHRYSGQQLMSNT